jgi:hypothetical protein
MYEVVYIQPYYIICFVWLFVVYDSLSTTETPQRLYVDSYFIIASVPKLI